MICCTPRQTLAGPLLRVPAQAVRAGDAVELSWSGLPRSAHEVEFELSLDGGSWRRISPEIEGAEGAFCWHVPAGYSGEARVRMRWGGEGYESEGVIAMLHIDPAKVDLHPRAGDGWWDLGTSSPNESGALDRAQAVYTLPVLPAAVPVAPEGFDAPASRQQRCAVLRDDGQPAARPLERAFLPQRVTPLRN